MQIRMLLAGLFLCLGLPSFSEDVPMFRGNTQHTGVYEAAGVTKFTKVKWKFHTAAW
jgi:hypothetical protein